MFKILIEGKTIKDLKANVDEFIREIEVFKSCDKITGSQEKIEEVAAKLPELPKDLAPEVAPPISTIAVAPLSEPSKPPPISNDYGVDSRGLPWDERIHSVTQAKNKNGTWRYKRGVEESQIKTVEAELATKVRGIQSESVAASPQVPVVPDVPAIPQPAVPPAPSMSHLNVVPTPPVAVAPPPLPPPQPAVPSAHTFETFKATLVPTLAKLVKDGKLSQEYLAQLCEHYKVDMLFKVTEQQLHEVFEGFVQYGLIEKVQ
jgi:hypothetical protein